MEIGNYYDEFLNREYVTRDFHSIGSTITDHFDSRFPNVRQKRLIKSREKYKRNLFYTIGFVKDGISYSDRLFFDFDLDNPYYKDLTSSSEKRDMLFKSDILETPFDDVSRLYDYLIDNGAKPYVVFSGSKGFHLYCFFEPIPMLHYDKISKRCADKFNDALNLTSLDYNVFTNRRQSRLPYGRHRDSDLFTFPCNINSSIEDILYESLNPTIKDFYMSDYIFDGFSEYLKGVDNSISEFLQKQKELKSAKRKKQRESRKGVIFDGYIDFDSIDGVDVIRDVASEYYVKTLNGKDIYLCPFHNDNSHSAYVYHNTGLFGCSVCEFKPMTFYNFIAEFYGLTDPNEIINEIKKHIDLNS
ncbi:hypothetical protein [Methanobrevibacter sp.]|uniref:hypothetical protein n=1 Tax=Methanobrevibacter sp. TaxID=66852 RepID=UPI00386EA670